jgi:ribosomal protein S12 methylthiotransferase
MPGKVGMVSLGCSKNAINSEQMLGLLKEAGYELTAELAEVDTLIINTCAFIESAKMEAIENILEFAALKEEGKLKKIIVTGCLSQRYKEEILKELPEVDGLVGCGSFNEIVKALTMAENGEVPLLFGDIDAPVDETERVVSSPEGWAYIKIAEGCDNHCAYCVIPSIRGRYRSRPMENILEEARKLADGGVKELILIAQDITRYGTDLYGRRRLSELVKELAKIEGIKWIRLHYLYPDMIDDELIDTIKNEEKVVKYLDIPIQHINDKVLKLMNRQGSGAEIRALFKRLRSEIPGLVIRTSLITGLPGEGEAEFEELSAFLQEAKLERAGVFTFSPEEGTPAAGMERADVETAQHRCDLLVSLQSRIMDEFNQSRLGSIIEVMAEDYDRLAEYWYGRSYADSPDVDGKVFFTSGGAKIKRGEFYKVRVDDVLEGDLLGEVVE